MELVREFAAGVGSVAFLLAIALYVAMKCRMAHEEFERVVKNDHRE